MESNMESVKSLQTKYAGHTSRPVNANWNSE